VEKLREDGEKDEKAEEAREEAEAEEEFSRHFDGRMPSLHVLAVPHWLLDMLCFSNTPLDRNPSFVDAGSAPRRLCYLCTNPLFVLILCIH